ncbi:AraC family transcriptional regulator [Vibrio sp. WXL103]|uniref:AraC family transcriptional regulator n=1 Tax=unclassified Vibrio TaxID=2614977 RepID=UPI003EC6B26E
MKNSPMILGDTVGITPIRIRSFWDVIGDESYLNIWPRDRKLPMADNTLVIIYTEKGQGLIELNSGEIIKIRGNSLLFLEPASIKGYWCDGYMWKLFWIEVYIEQQLKDLVTKQKTIQFENNRYFNRQFEELLTVFANDDIYSRNYAAALFNKIFHEWLLINNSQKGSKNQELVSSVIDEMYYHLSENWHVSQMAKYAACSEQHLRKQFLIYTKTTPKDYYKALKLDISLGMLKRGTKPVNQVAYELGFSDAYHFSNSFRKYFGYSPSKVKPVMLSRNEISIEHRPALSPE